MISVWYVCYRVWMFFNSLVFLWTLSKEDLKNFLDSYVLYDAEKAKQLTQDEIHTKLFHYYYVLNKLCSLGPVEKMYIPPLLNPKAGLRGNQNLFEEQLIRDLAMPTIGRVLDVGCGRGLVAAHVARETKAHVYGINIDYDQVYHAQNMARYAGLPCYFLVHDFNRYPFPFDDNTFDAVYQIQAFSMAQDLPAVFAELFRIMKPGARLVCLDWVQLANYDALDAVHANLMKQVKPLIGAMGTLTEKEYVDAMYPYFTVLKQGTLHGKSQAGLIEEADGYFTRLAKVIEWGVRCWLIPAHVGVLFERLTRGGKAFVEADKRQITTTSFYVTAVRKERPD